MKATAAKPVASVGDLVRYVDRHGRPQSGKIRYMEARWQTWSKPGDPPYVIYCVEHPSYHRGQCYTGKVKPQT